MISKISLILILCLPVITYASSVRTITPEEGHPDECPLGDGLFLKAGEKTSGCPPVICRKDGDKLTLIVSNPAACRRPVPRPTPPPPKPKPF